MEAVGRLAGGVAHDLNNLLTVIGAHSRLLLDSLDSGDIRHEGREAVQNATIRAAGLTRQLPAFTRREILDPVALSLNTIIDETRRMLARDRGTTLRIYLPIVSMADADTELRVAESA